MGFLKETTKLLGIDENATDTVFCHVYPPKAIVVEGYKKLYELSNTKISLLCEQYKKIDIVGEGLQIKELSYREIAITGNIVTLNFSS